MRRSQAHLSTYVSPSRAPFVYLSPRDNYLAAKVGIQGEAADYLLVRVFIQGNTSEEPLSGVFSALLHASSPHIVTELKTRKLDSDGSQISHRRGIRGWLLS